MGEKICAIIAPKAKGGVLSIESLQDLFRGAGLAQFKWPERVRMVDALPRNAVGKVVRSALVPIAEQTD